MSDLTVLDALIERWNAMPLDLKRYYEYQIEKHHPLRPDRYNSRIDFKYMWPDPEKVILFTLSHPITRTEHGKIINPDRNMQRRVLKTEWMFVGPVKVDPVVEIGDLEGHIHELMWEKCPEYVPRIYNHSWDDYPVKVHIDGAMRDLVKRLSYLELEWLPHGDLHQLLCHYSLNKRMLPEPFIWYVFLALAKVAVICLNGRVSDTKDPAWDRICHLDIKPENIFLGAPDPAAPLEWARAYPVPKVADWGMAYHTTALHQGDLDDPLEWPRNPQDLQGGGTCGYMPPELLTRSAVILSDLHEAHSLSHDLPNGTHIHDRKTVFPRPDATLARINALMPCPNLPYNSPSCAPPDESPPYNPRPERLPPDAKCGVDSWTTVWQIGTVIWQLLAGATVPDRRVDFAPRTRDDFAARRGGGDDNDDSGEDEYVDGDECEIGADLSKYRDYPARRNRNGPLRPRYSGRLVELCYACLHADPAERMDVWRVYEEVVAGCGDVGRELKKEGGREREGLLGRGAVPVVLAADKYPIAGVVLNDRPRVPVRP
ncbi:hypothetical protein SLS55_000219 [Diplodia seriata]|uniref:non-specific serine/threonine protein kinase n=1 Tax=Diplodia seriata TaxID=420778 RepID=A0ABR3CTP6_9PEZI